MNLIIDIGNSSAKIALTENGEIIANSCYTEISKEIIEELLLQYTNIRTIILSSTKQLDGDIELYVKSKIGKTIIYDHTTPVPLKNLYATPETLGMDRLAAAVGAWSIEPDEELLIFDLGTAITIDRVTAAGEYIGGNIAPGLRMRFEALHKFTGRLPLVEYEQGGNDQLFGTDTTSAIWNGVVRGIEYEIDGYITQNPTAKLFFTGRDAKYFVNCRENTIFVDYQLVIKGLERIIKYNAK